MRASLLLTFLREFGVRSELQGGPVQRVDLYALLVVLYNAFIADDAPTLEVRHGETLEEANLRLVRERDEARSDSAARSKTLSEVGAILDPPAWTSMIGLCQLARRVMKERDAALLLTGEATPWINATGTGRHWTRRVGLFKLNAWRDGLWQIIGRSGSGLVMDGSAEGSSDDEKLANAKAAADAWIGEQYMLLHRDLGAEDPEPTITDDVIHQLERFIHTSTPPAERWNELLSLCAVARSKRESWAKVRRAARHQLVVIIDILQEEEILPKEFGK